MNLRRLIRKLEQLGGTASLRDDYLVRFPGTTLRFSAKSKTISRSKLANLRTELQKVGYDREQLRQALS